MPTSIANQSSRSSKSTSAMSPTDTRPEKPTRRSAANASNDTVMAPDCEITARSPAGGRWAAKLASSPMRGARTPRQLGPMMRNCVRAASACNCAFSELGPWPEGSEVMTMATGAPMFAASSASARTCARGAATMTMSGAWARSERLATQVCPSISLWRGLTR